jgi:hypothetical protein
MDDNRKRFLWILMGMGVLVVIIGGIGIALANWPIQPPWFYNDSGYLGFNETTLQVHNDENFYFNIENAYNETIYYNISKYSNETFSFRVRGGRHFVLAGDEI